MDAYTRARQERIAEDTISLIDYASRVLGAIERGDWLYAADKLDGLRDRVDRLAKRVDPDQPGNLREIRGETVWAKVASEARNYWLGRAIFGEKARAS